MEHKTTVDTSEVGKNHPDTRPPYRAADHQTPPTAPAMSPPQPTPNNSMGGIPTPNVTIVITQPPAQKSLFEAYLLCLPLGVLGLHHFYLRRYGFGVLYLLTLGVCGVGWLVDIFRMPALVKDANHRILHPEDDVTDVSICDAYITWFPLGIIGLHHYYLRNYHWGVAYTFTIGLFGIGWLVDAVRIPSLVRATNGRLELERSNTLPRKASLCDAYVLGATPAGLFGGHHFYLGRPDFGIYYLFTLGGCGVGWIVDWFRMKWLVDRANNPEAHPLGKRHKYVDDAYVMAIPLGVLGLHHFYLHRTGWGLLYLFTLGLAGIGWLVDLCRMPCLVSDCNKRLESEMQVMADIRQQLGVQASAILRREIYYPPGPHNSTVMNPATSGPSSNQIPSFQPPSYEDTMATGSSLATSSNVGGAKANGGNTNEGFENVKY